VLYTANHSVGVIMLKINELEKLQATELTQKVSELRKELFDLKLQKSTTSVEKSHLLVTVKRDIARLLTVVNRKQASK
jgi:large subunit ribosomal protein L29